MNSISKVNNELSGNNFGALRLLFACLVIVGHSFEQTAGGWPSEILTRITGTLDVGEVSVDGFFLISGYLITASYYGSSSVKSYLIKRCLRIHPAFAIATLVSIFVFAPLSGGWELFADYTWKDWLKIPGKILILSEPWVEGAFRSLQDPTSQAPLNLPTWTIRYEFICYLTVPVAAYCGLYKRNIFAGVVAILLSVYFLIQYQKFHDNYDSDYMSIIRFLTTFSVGAAFYVHREQLVWNKKISLICTILLCSLITNAYWAREVLILCGGYLMFNFALNFKHAFINNIGRTNDISYGVYLYAWPFQMLLIKYHPDISPWTLTAYALVFAMVMGYLSWKLVEKPFMQMKRRLA
jgi:peptidoglycan/LPS O-acetylase OafA/YrhL